MVKNYSAQMELTTYGNNVIVLDVVNILSADSFLSKNIIQTLKTCNFGCP